MRAKRNWSFLRRQTGQFTLGPPQEQKGRDQDIAARRVITICGALGRVHAFRSEMPPDVLPSVWLQALPGNPLRPWVAWAATTLPAAKDDLSSPDIPVKGCEQLKSNPGEKAPDHCLVDRRAPVVPAQRQHRAPRGSAGSAAGQGRCEACLAGCVACHHPACHPWPHHQTHHAAIFTCESCALTVAVKSASENGLPRKLALLIRDWAATRLSSA